MAVKLPTQQPCMRSQCCHRIVIPLCFMPFRFFLRCFPWDIPRYGHFFSVFQFPFCSNFIFKYFIFSYVLLIFNQLIKKFPPIFNQQFCWHYSEWDWQTCSLVKIHECHVLHLISGFRRFPLDAAAAINEWEWVY